MTAPITAAERALLPDILRGLALGGILLVNIQNFAGYVPWQQSGADAAAQAFIDFFANGKFISTFALLFGAGAALFVARAGTARFARRLVALLLIGLTHGIFIWVGDILASYAIVAFVLTPLLLAPRALQALLVPLLLGVTLLSVAGLALSAGMGPTDPSFAGVNALYARGSYGEVLPVRAGEYLSGYVQGAVLFYGPWLLGLFLIGVLLARGGVLQDPARFTRPLRATALLALLVGVPLNVAFVNLAARDDVAAQTWSIALRFGGGLAFALLYGALTALLVARGRALWLRPLANVGRLALSNYLLSSVVCTLVFNAYGLGLYGRLGALGALSFAAALFALQVVLSGLYLRRFSRGPAEWLLRALTYGFARRAA